MALKIAFIIAAVCAIQGFALPPYNPLVPRSGTCKPIIISSSTKVVSYEFEDILQQFEDLSQTFSASAAEAAVKGADPEVVIACFRAQKGPLFALAKQVAGMTRQAAEELAQELDEKYQSLAQRAKVSMNKIAEIMRQTPMQMWTLIKDKEFEKAVELLKESRRLIVENAKDLVQVLSELKEVNSEIGEKAEKKIFEIRDFARGGCQKIREDFRDCVKAGGPDKEVLAVEGEGKVAIEN